MSPLLFYVGAVIVLTAILLAAAVTQMRPTRPCPLCEQRVDITNRRCKHCGYDFSPVRLGR